MSASLCVRVNASVCKVRFFLMLSTQYLPGVLSIDLWKIGDPQARSPYPEIPSSSIAISNGFAGAGLLRSS